MKIGLIICPWYSGGTSAPLGLSYINSILKRKGHETIPLDIEFELNKINLNINRIINTIFGYPSNNPDEIMFINQIELVMRILYANAIDNEKTITFDKKEIAIENIKTELREIVNRFIKLHHPEIFMFSVYNSNLAISLMAAQIIKKIESVPIIFGGPGVSLYEIYKLILKTGIVNGIVVGEGEETVAEIIEERKIENTSENISGYVTTKSLNSFRSRRLIENLDSLPYPDFAGFPGPDYNLRAYLISGKGTFIPIATSRGCIMKCSFCSESQFWKVYRLRSVESVVDEICYQTKKYNINHIRFNDSLINSDKEWLIRLCDTIIKRRISINWVFAYMRPKDIDKKLALRMKRAGCRFICLGLESGSSEIRRRMKKGTKKEEILIALKSLAEANINALINIVDGFPDESVEDIADTIRLFESFQSMSKNNSKYIVWGLPSRMRLEPFSDMYRNPNNYGIKIASLPIKAAPGLGKYRSEIKTLSLNWSDSVPEKEKNIRNDILNYYFLSRQSDLLEKMQEYQNVDSELVTPSTILKSILYPDQRIVCDYDNNYIIFNKNVKKIDELSYNIYRSLEESPKSLEEIQTEILSHGSLRPEIIISSIIDMINSFPYPLVRIMESEDMHAYQNIL